MTERGVRRVVCAAMLSPDQNVLVVGARHGDAVMRRQLEAFKTANYHRWQEGFIDQWGAFMTRKEAWAVAEAQGQVLFRCGGDGADRFGLFSENLY